MEKLKTVRKWLYQHYKYLMSYLINFPSCNHGFSHHCSSACFLTAAWSISFTFLFLFIHFCIVLLLYFVYITQRTFVINLKPNQLPYKVEGTRYNSFWLQITYVFSLTYSTDNKDMKFCHWPLTSGKTD